MQLRTMQASLCSCFHHTYFHQEKTTHKMIEFRKSLILNLYLLTACPSGARSIPTQYSVDFNDNDRHSPSTAGDAVAQDVQAPQVLHTDIVPASCVLPGALSILTQYLIDLKDTSGEAVGHDVQGHQVPHADPVTAGSVPSGYLSKPT